MFKHLSKSQKQAKLSGALWNEDSGCVSELGLSMDGGVSHVAFLYLGPSFLVEVIQIFR